jgi:hypothetical protein
MMAVVLSRKLMLKSKWFLLAGVISFSFVLIGCGGGKIGSPTSQSSQNASNKVQSHTISDIQSLPDWIWCTQKRNGGVCAAGLGVATSSMTPKQMSPSVGGDASVFSLGGSVPYSNALWWRSLDVPTSATHFTYDVYFYLQAPSAPEALEFDANQSYGGVRYTWGTECSYLNTGHWDIWDPKNQKWVTTSVPCKQASANVWHHLVWQFEKLNGQVHYIGVSLDGNFTQVDRLFEPQSNWNASETNVAFQMDGNFRQQSYNVWLDHLNLTTW